MIPRVRIKVVGYNLDQIINKLQNSNIVCYEIKRAENNVVLFTTSFKYLNKLKSLLKNYEYNIDYLGLANLKRFVVKNLAIIVSLPIAVMLMVFSTYFIWNIKIYGTDTNLNLEIIEVLKNNNIKVGGRLPQTIDDVEQILLNQLPNVAQVSCIKRGTTLIINVSPKLVYSQETYEPIKAKFNGIIASFSLISGTLAVNIGDFVSEGDVLVYPFTLDKEGNQVSVRPMAEIKAKVYVIGSAKLNATSTQLARTGREYTTSSITILNKKLFSKKVPKPFAIYETKMYNENISSVLPIVKTTVIYYELDYKVVNYDLESEKPKIEQESVNLAYKNLPTNSEILDEQTSSLIVNDCLYSTTTLTIYTIIS